MCTMSVGPGLEALGFAPNELVGTDLYDLYRKDELASDGLDAVLAGRRYASERKYRGRRLALLFEPVFDH